MFYIVYKITNKINNTPLWKSNLGGPKPSLEN